MAVIINSSAVLSTLSTLPPYPMNHARIGYQSFLPDADLTASTAAAGFPSEAVTNGLTYDQWRTESLPATLTIDLLSAKDCDYLGIAAHNLATIGAVVDIEYSLDEGATWTTLESMSPEDNTPIMLIFSTITARYWRAGITAPSGQAQIGAINLGQALVMQRPIYGGHTPITMSRRTEYQNNISDSGQWMGRTVVRKGVSTSFEWKHLTAGWYREYFSPFVKACRTTPFFIAWYPSKFPREVGYCWTNGDIAPSNMGIRDLMSVTLKVDGFSDD